jgi:hypothetical protein
MKYCWLWSWGDMMPTICTRLLPRDTTLLRSCEDIPVTLPRLAFLQVFYSLIALTLEVLEVAVDVAHIEHKQ